MTAITDDDLVKAAITARMNAEGVEQNASPLRWDEADAYSELSERGWTQQKIGDECGAPQSRVSKFISCSRNYSVLNIRPAFWEAFSEVNSEKEKKAHVDQATGEIEWYTPAEFIDAARDLMGEIDLDPASSEAANDVVGAMRYYSPSDDGLAMPWRGRVWMNPPYSQPLISQFCSKFIDEYLEGDVTEGVVLINNATETSHFQNLLSCAVAVCFPAGRIRFWHPERDSVTPLQGQALIYFGENRDGFRTRFGEFGMTVLT